MVSWMVLALASGRICGKENPLHPCALPLEGFEDRFSAFLHELEDSDPDLPEDVNRVIVEMVRLTRLAMAGGHGMHKQEALPGKAAFLFAPVNATRQITVRYPRPDIPWQNENAKQAYLSFETSHSLSRR